MELKAAYAAVDAAKAQSFERTATKFKQDIDTVMGYFVNGKNPPAFSHKEFKFPLIRCEERGREKRGKGGRRGGKKTRR